MTEAFEGQRPAFEPGNQLAVKSGAYVSVLSLAPDAEPIADRLRELLHENLRHPMFEAAVQAAAIAGARLQRAEKALVEAASPAEVRRLEQDSRAWWKHWYQALGSLGLRPDTAASIGLNLSLAESARADLVKRYGSGGES